MANSQYLQRRHQSWYAVVEVPKELRAAVGKRRLLRSLKTQSFDEANRKKHAVVAEMKRQLDVLAKTPNKVEARALAKAMQRRREYLEAGDTEIYPDDAGGSISSRGLVLEDIRWDVWHSLDWPIPRLATDTPSWTAHVRFWG